MPVRRSKREPCSQHSIVQPSTSPFGSMALIVKKKDGSPRVVIDYRALNEVTVKNKYPLPLMDELFDRTQGARFFTSIDLINGFHQIAIRPEDREKTAFRTRFGIPISDGDARHHPRGAALAFRRVGSIWLRVDLADRLATHAHLVKQGGGDDPVDHALATSLGLDADTLKRLMAEVGFVPLGAAWKWRGHHRQQGRPAPSRPDNAFAALANLKR